MPYLAARPCPTPGCKKLIRGKEKRCADHLRFNNANRPETDKQYNTARWQKMRDRKLKSNPLCERCESLNKITIAVLVDHITPVRDQGEMFDENNLQSLCRDCHDIKTADDLKKRSKWPEEKSLI
jgi:5-methylcytosine-specific restriction enzyme A